MFEPFIRFWVYSAASFTPIHRHGKVHSSVVAGMYVHHTVSAAEVQQLPLHILVLVNETCLLRIKGHIWGFMSSRNSLELMGESETDSLGEH